MEKWLLPVVCLSLAIVSAGMASAQQADLMLCASGSCHPYSDAITINDTEQLILKVGIGNGDGRFACIGGFNSRFGIVPGGDYENGLSYNYSVGLDSGGDSDGYAFCLPGDAGETTILYLPLGKYNRLEQVEKAGNWTIEGFNLSLIDVDYVSLDGSGDEHAPVVHLTSPDIRFSVVSTLPKVYSLNMTEPTALNAVSVTAGQDVPLHFNFTEGSEPVASGVSVSMVTIGGEEAGAAGAEAPGDGNLSFVKKYDLRSNGNITTPTDIYYDGDFYYIADGSTAEVYLSYPNRTYSGIHWDTAASGDGRPEGIYCDAAYCWVTDAPDAEVYEYYKNGTYTGSHFDTAASGNGNPEGIYYDGSLFFVTDSADDEVYVYDSGWAYTGSHFDTAASGDGEPSGITGDGEHIWIADYSDSEIYEYYENGTYTGNHFDTYADNVRGTTGVYTDGSYIYAVGYDSQTVGRYGMDGTYVQDSVWGVCSGIGNVRYTAAAGVTTDGTWVWIGDFNAKRILKYYPDMTYTGEYFDDAPTGYSVPEGIVQNGTFIWVTDWYNREIYKHYMNGTYTGEHFDTASAGLGEPEGIYFNGTHFWIVDFADAEVYIFTEDGTYTGEHWDTAYSGNTGPQGITFDGTYFWIIDNYDADYANPGSSIYKYYANGTYTGYYYNLTSSDGLWNSEGVYANSTNIFVVNEGEAELFLYSIDAGATQPQSYESSYVPGEGWHVSVTAPSDLSGLQDLRLSVSYDGTAYEAYEPGAIDYGDVDVTAPQFTWIPGYETITYGTDWAGVDFVAQDDEALDSFRVNDSRFTMSPEGHLDAGVLDTGGYMVEVSVNDTSGNANSVPYVLTVLKADASGSVGGYSQVTYGTAADVQGTETNEGDGDVTYALYRDGAQVGNPDGAILAAGEYHYLYNSTGGANYNPNPSIGELYLTVSPDGGSCSVIFSETPPLNYTTAFTAWSDCSSDFALYRNGTQIDNGSVQMLQPGTWNFTVARTDCQNYSNCYDEKAFEILPAPDTVPPSYSQAGANSTYAGEPALFSLYVTDGGALEPEGYFVFSTNNSGTWEDDPAVNFTQTPSWANVTKTLNAEGNVAIGYMWHLYDSAGNADSTPSYFLTTQEQAAASYPSIEINAPLSQTYTTPQVTFNVSASDEDGVSSCTYSLDSAQNVSMSQSGAYWTATSPTMENGQHGIVFYCNDTLGYRNSTLEMPFSVDFTPTPALREGYNTGDDAHWYVYGVNEEGQSFTVGNTGPNEDFYVTHVRIKAYRQGYPGNVTFSIYADSGGVPTGSPLSTTVVNANEWGTSPTWITIEMPQARLDASAQYSLNWKCPQGSTSNRPHLRYEYTSPTYTGGTAMESHDSGSSWAPYPPNDYMFEIWGYSA